MEYLQGLNEKQLEAVLATEGYVRVIAGAGSGKTKLLVSRYAYLVKEYGIDPSNILCVTFTNKAAAEMKKRIRAAIGDQYDTALICTYHGFCARLLREDAEKLFLSRDFQIIDTVQQKTILGEIYQKRELKLDYAGFEKILKQIGKYKSEEYLTYVPRICDPENRQIITKASTLDDEIIEEYMQRQKAIGALDFHDLLSFALYLLDFNANVRRKWQEKLNYIQVDEFQDSSTREMRLIDILSDQYRNLMIVGDPDQNIYEWRGSDVRLLVDFDKQHLPTQTIFLNRNYRSTPQILSCANFLIDKNVLRLKKDLFTLSPDGARVVHYHSKSDAEESETIARLIKQTIRGENRSYSDFAVLYRSGFLSRTVENRLVEKNIPYEIYGGVKFYQRMEVLDVIAYLKLIAFDDDSSLKRIINKPRRRFGRVKLAALENLQEAAPSLPDNGTAVSLLTLLSENIGESPFKNSDAGNFVKLISEIKKESHKLRITEIVNRVTVESGYEQYIRELGDEERYENLMEFKRIADEFERNFGEDLTLPEFLQQIALQAGEDKDSDRDTVKLMTIHAAKGLEFPVVFVIGFSEGIFPSSKTIEERKQLGLEEERRLCYVAITRAEKQLYLMDSEGFSQNGIKKLPSRFLREIGSQNYDRIGIISDELDRESRAYTARLNEGIFTGQSSLYSVGDTVEHHAFGKGTVLSVSESRGTMLVQFEKINQPRNISVEYFKSEHKKITLPHTAAGFSENTERSYDRKDSETAFKPEPPEEKEEPTPEKILPADQAINDPDREICPKSVQPKKAEQKEETVSSQEPSSFPENTRTYTEEQLFILPEGKAGTVSLPPKNKKSDGRDKDEAAEDNKSKCGIDPAVLEKRADSENLWKRDDVPHSGWCCAGVTDLGGPYGVCEMCGYQIIRYVHHMVHPGYHPLNVGCVCAGKMEGDVEAAKKREQDFKNKQSRRESFQKRQWKRSRNGNPYLKIKNHIIVLYLNGNRNVWKYSIDSQFCSEIFTTKEDAMNASFEALEMLINN